MTTLPRITVITPSYNQGGYIGQTIESVLGQEYPNLEYIVVDGGSTDETLDVLRQYDGQLAWTSERDRGQSHAINKGLCRATGEIVAFLNSDDLYMPGALSRVGEFFARHPQASWLTGKCRIIDQHSKEIRKAITLYKSFWLRLRSYKALLVLDYVSQPATFWRRRVIDHVGFFDESLNYAMDYDYSLRVGRQFKLWVLNEYLAAFRVHPTSKAGSSANAQMDADLKIAKQHTSSPVFRGLHAVHNAMIVATYRVLMARDAWTLDAGQVAVRV
jgi:glycosyltransferase involved in cell wall biosynthesis